MGGTVIIVEEAAYLSKTTFVEVVVPILTLEESCLVAISTLGATASNFFNQLIKSGYFFVYAVTYVCEKCIEKGIQNECKHLLDSIPHWSNDTMLEKVKLIAGEDNRDKFERENLGIVSEESAPNCFSESSVNDMMTTPRLVLCGPVRYVFVCIDPSAGTDIPEANMSDFAVVSIGGPYTTIVGMEAIDAVEPSDYQDRLLEHIRRIRATKYMEDAILVLDVESGTGQEAGHIYALVQGRFQNVITMKDFHRKPGTKTLNSTKKEMMELTRALLNARDVRILKDFVTTDPHPLKLLEKFRAQMHNYMRYVSVGRTIHQRNTETFSGKGPNKKGQDDLCVTFQRAIRMRKEFLFSGRYDKFHF